MNTTINIYLKREQLYIVLLFLFLGGKIEDLNTLIDTKNKDNKKLQSIYDVISELH